MQADDFYWAQAQSAQHVERIRRTRGGRTRKQLPRVVVLAKCASVELFARSVSWLKVGGDDELGRRWRERARILGDSETAVAFVIVPASPMWMCKAWTHRLTHFAMCLEVFRHTSVYLSVLGGALAAIGKSSQKHAVKALQLARRQRVLAFYLGDDDLAARCHLYEAEAYVHLGKPALAVKIVAHERERHASNLVMQSICDSVESKLALFYSLRVK